MAQPGPGGTASFPRQHQPHPHQVIMDPSGKFLIVPDLGADLIRIYLMSHDERLRFTALAPVLVPAGSGPRHGTFVVTPENATYFYLASEITNVLTGYKITYTSSSTIDFTEIYKSGIHGIGGVFEQGQFLPDQDIFPTQASEVHVSVSQHDDLYCAIDSADCSLASSSPMAGSSL